MFQALCKLQQEINGLHLSYVFTLVWLGVFFFTNEGATEKRRMLRLKNLRKA